MLRGLDERLAVCFIQSLGSGVFLLASADGLTRAADTAGCTGHDFDEIKVFFSGFHLRNERSRILETVYNTDTDGLFADGQLDRADALHAANAGVGDFLQSIAGLALHNAADDSLCHAAGCAEDHTCTGAKTEGHIGRFVGQLIEADTGFLDHADELLRGENEVNIGLVAVLELFSGRFHLLGRAGHDGDVIELLAAFFFLCAENGGEHLHRRLAGRNIVQILGILLLEILDPCRTAARKHRERAALLESLEEFRCLFHDGHIRRECGVVDLVCAHELERGDHLVKHVHAGGKAERFAECNADGRGNLDDNAKFRIMQRLPCVVDLVADGDGAGRADSCALAAGDALGHAHRAVECRHNLNVAAAVSEVQNAHALQFVAHAHAVAAENALARIADDRGACLIQRIMRTGVFKRDIRHAEAQRQFLQSAVAAFFAGGAAAAMGREHQRKNHPAVLEQPLGVRADTQTVARLHGAGGVDFTGLFVFYHAHTACAEGRKLGVIAERRHVDSGLADDREDVLFSVKRHANTVDVHFTFCHTFNPPPSQAQ